MFKNSVTQPSFFVGAMAVMILLSCIVFRIDHIKPANADFCLAVILIIIDWIMTLRLITRNCFLDTATKLFWMAFATLLPPIGSMIYIMMENRKPSAAKNL